MRPDPVFGNVVEVVSDARSRQHVVSTNVSYSFSAPSPDLNKVRFTWKRTSFSLGHFVGRSRNNTDGAFTMPPSGDLATEWGPAPGDVRQRLFFFISTSALKNFNVFLNMNASTAPPLHDQDRSGRQRRFGLQRSAGRCGTKHRALAWTVHALGELRLHPTRTTPASAAP